MLDFSTAHFNRLAIHQVGNKHNGDDLHLYDKSIDVSNEEQNAILSHYFLSHFNTDEILQLSHGNHLSLNVLYNIASQFFQDTDSLMDSSKHIAKHLYDCSTHAKIKNGDVIVVPIYDCVFDDEVVNAIGIFKAENKSQFYKIDYTSGNPKISMDSGFQATKLDKGCIIFNTFGEEGFRVLVVDNTSPEKEANFWRDDFIQVERVKNNAFYTEEFIKMCKDFSDEPEALADKQEKRQFINKTIDYLKSNDTINTNAFVEEVLSYQDEPVKDKFIQFRESYFEEKNIPKLEDIEISQTSIVKEKRKIKDIIKLDNKVEIKMNGANNMLKKGFDDKMGMYYYQIFFNEES